MLKYIFLILVLTSCITSKIPTSKGVFSGTIMTCKTDSTSLTGDSIVLIKRNSNCNGCNCHYFSNPKCANRPDYADSQFFWPSNIILNIKEKRYTTLHSPHPTDPNIKYGEPNFTVTYKFDTGNIEYNNKKSTLTLKSLVTNWTRTYTVQYSPEDSIIILKYKNGI